MKHKILVKAAPDELEDKLNFCKEKFGHRGAESGWWWTVKKQFKDKLFVFSFNNEEDALLFKLSKG